MRVFVFGVLLAHTLNAQVSDIGTDGIVTALEEPAPLITPNADAPTEADLLRINADATSDDAALESSAGGEANADTGTELPSGTADVIVDTTPTNTVSENPTTTEDTFGADMTGDQGIEFNGSEFEFPTASDESGLGADATATLDAGADAKATADQFADLPTDGSETTPVDDSVADSSEVSTLDGDVTATNELLEEIPTETPGVLESEVGEPAFGTQPLDLNEGVEEFATATPALEADAIELGETGDQTDVLAEQTGVDSLTTLPEPVIFPNGGVSGADVTEDPSLVAPEVGGEDTAAAPKAANLAGLEEPAPVEETTELQPTKSSSTLDLGPTPLLDPLAGSEVAPGLGGALSGGTGAAYADDGSAGTWTGEDTGNYDGQDVGDEECPAYCYEEDEYETDDTTTAYSAESDEDDEDSDDSGDDSFLRRVVRWISRRALGSEGGFAAFAWPVDGEDKTASYDPEDTEDCDDVPEWLYEAEIKELEDCPAPKAKCPAKCYEYGTSKPYPVSSIPDSYQTYSTPAASSAGPEYSAWSSAKEEYTPYPVPDESTTGYYELTISSTQTTFVTSTTTAAYAGSRDSAAGADYTGAQADNAGAQADNAGAQADYTGDTLASVCPKTCDPFDPAANKCDITSSCTTTGKGKYYCACRAGYRASAWNAKDFSKQFKFPDQPYVYTAEGVVCDKVCSDQTCTEVLSRPQCQ